jgi:exopolyphosphatase/pppGpp-phosphohydrolase
VRVLGDEPWHLARVERGGDLPESTVPLAREEAEEVFRALATERRADRLQNPGLDPGRVDTILGTCCVVIAVMRRLRLDRVLVGAAAGTG